MTTGCIKSPDMLEQALQISGDNRAALEEVLQHYGSNPADRLKLRAAEFLIANMPGKYMLDTLSMAANQPYFDAMAASRIKNGGYAENETSRICDSVKTQMPHAVEPKPRYTSDLQTLTAQFLIRHIDRSFETWDASPWAEDLSFDTFCRYILPYATKGDYWDDSHAFFRTAYASLPDSLADMYAAGKHIASDVQGSFSHGGSFFREYPFFEPMTFRNLMAVRVGGCIDMCCAGVSALRSVSIPASLDMIPWWGNAQNNHFLCELIGDSLPEHYDNTQRIWSKPEDELIKEMFWSNNPPPPREGIPSQVDVITTRTIPKIFRDGYAIQHNSLIYQAANKGEEIPEIFRNSCLEDISSQYLVCEDATVSLDKPNIPRKYAYLCCFNPNSIFPAPVDWAPVKRNKAAFRNVGVNVLYFPAYYINGRMEPAGTPFVLLPRGECKYMTPKRETHDTVVLYNKIPYRSYIMRYASRMLNGRFQTANRPDLSDTATIHTIHTVPFYEQTVSVDQAPAGRYGIYCFAGMKYGDIAEMEFWGINESGEEEKLEGQLIGNPGMYNHERNYTIDGDRVSFFSALPDGAPYIALDFGKPRRITRIKYSPRSDDNGIVPGELYELFYWDKTGWISLGKQEGRNDYTLVYTNVPKDALLNIRNHTRGKENRPFTYENGKQVWW
jgi:hypothetical protein